MGKGMRQTFYFKSLPGMKKVAEEEGEDVNGSVLETLYWNQYAGNDPNYRDYILLYYNGDISLKDCMQGMIHVMAYTPGYMKKDNLEFVKCVRDVIGGSEWITPAQDSKHEAGDYALGNREYHLDYVFNVFDNILWQIKNNIEFINSTPIIEGTDYKPWTLTAQDKRYKEVLSDQSNYTNEGIQQLEYRIRMIRKELEGEISPGRAMELIISNWDYLWQFKTTYEGIEYCLLLSRHLTEKPAIRRQLRHFAKKDSEEKNIINIYIETAVKKEVIEQSNERLSKYAKKLKGDRI